MHCAELTDNEVRSCIKFSGRFNNAYAETTSIHELRKQLQWIRTHHPNSIPDHVQSKLNTRCMFDLPDCLLCSIFLIGGMILLQIVANIGMRTLWNLQT